MLLFMLSAWLEPPDAAVHALSTVGRPVAESHEACTTAEWGGEMYRPY